MQKFQKGDWVMVAKDLGPSMSHFTADCDAIVIGSYADQYGGKCNDYTLHLKGQGQCSWYRESQLTLIEPGRLDKLKRWEEERNSEQKQKSDLDWIFSHWEEVLSKPHGASIGALADCLGVTNLWGAHGEGFSYLINARNVIQLAAPYLENGDKAGWLSYCESIKGMNNA